MQFDIQIGIPAHTMTIQQQFADSTGQLYGFMIYISNAGNAYKFKPKNFLSKCIWSSETFSFQSPTLVGSNGARFTVDTSNNMFNSKYGVNQNRWFYVSLVITGTNCTQILGGRVCVQCQI